MVSVERMDGIHGERGRRPWGVGLVSMESMDGIHGERGRRPWGAGLVSVGAGAVQQQSGVAVGLRPAGGAGVKSRGQFSSCKTHTGLLHGSAVCTLKKKFQMNRQNNLRGGEKTPYLARIKELHLLMLPEI